MNKLKKDNVLNFPSKMTEIEREVEAIVFAAAEPLSIETIETKISKNTCTFEMIDETMKKTDLGNLKVGSLVNVERSLKVGERLEGHFVLGHVDGVAEIKKIEKKPKEVKVWFKIPKSLKKYVVKKGSIALDGISLTVVDVKNDLASVCLIPHTIEITNFKNKKINDKLNIETDVLGKYILK